MSSRSAKIGVALIVIALIAIIVTTIHLTTDIAIIVPVIVGSVLCAGVAIWKILSNSKPRSALIYIANTHAPNTIDVGNTPRDPENQIKHSPGNTPRGSYRSVDRPVNSNTIGFTIQE